jgi:hypothetical protein
MDKWLNKKEFIKMFEPFNEKGTQIWVISRIKKLPHEIEHDENRHTLG